MRDWRRKFFTNIDVRIKKSIDSMILDSPVKIDVIIDLKLRKKTKQT